MTETVPMFVRSTVAAACLLFSPVAAAQAPQPTTPTPLPAPRPPSPGEVLERAPSATPSRFEGLKDKALIKALRDAVAKHKDIGYSQARRVIFTALDNHEGTVKCVYTGRELRTTQLPNSSNMNVEHTWPQSKGATGAAKSDLHHLFPTDSKANSIRSSYPFGEVKTVKWSSPNGAKFGTDAQGRKVFEPPAEHKGNVARALFYFSTVYAKPIPLAEETVLKAWNQADQVDDAERSRNAAIEKYQGNRNPFVDDASLAQRISDF